MKEGRQCRSVWSTALARVGDARRMEIAGLARRCVWEERRAIIKTRLALIYLFIGARHETVSAAGCPISHRSFSRTLCFLLSCSVRSDEDRIAGMAVIIAGDFLPPCASQRGARHCRVPRKKYGSAKLGCSRVVCRTFALRCNAVNQTQTTWNG
jgi:hypothetical protein